MFSWKKNAAASGAGGAGSWLTRLKAAFTGVSLVDRCLLVFMLVLLLQSAYRIFLPGGEGDQLRDIDVIVRTASAAIFGYFLSANFMSRAAEKSGTAGTAAASVELEGGTGPAALRNPIGFTAAPRTELAAGGAAANPTDGTSGAKERCARLQVLVAFGIGLFCLLTLLVLCDVGRWSGTETISASVTATIAQFRDFVSGCVGFLIGTPAAGTSGEGT